MKVNSIIPSYYNNRNPIAFKSIDRDVEDSQGKLLYRNNTTTYRGDLPIKKIIQDITKRTIPPTIYCYACSDGSEPYTIAIELIKKLGETEAKKYFPIIARDIDERVINIAKSKKLGLYNHEARFVRDMVGKAIFDAMFQGPFAGNSVESGRSQYYKVSDKLTHCVEFEKGNIIDDAPTLKYDNSIILCRNVWPYFSKDDMGKLLNTFKRKFKQSTSLIMGDFDAEYSDSSYYRLEDILYRDAKLIQTFDNIYKLNSPKNMMISTVHNILTPISLIGQTAKLIYYVFKYKE